MRPTADENTPLDRINGVLWRDDVQVVDVHKRKRYSATPDVRVRIIPLITEVP